MSAICLRCAGTQWICKEHPDKPMEHDGCGGAGKPCPACNEMSDGAELPPDPNVINLLERIQRKRWDR